VRQDTETLVDRILDMVEICRTEPMTRQQLAHRWDVTPRTVNNIIYRAWPRTALTMPNSGTPPAACSTASSRGLARWSQAVAHPRMVA
jgi:hypothetical protein